HRFDGVGIFILATRCLAEGGYPGMHLIHEFMEVHATLLLERYSREKEVHQHGLAATDLAIEVEPAHRFSRLFEEAEQAFGFLGQKVTENAVELGGRIALRRISRQGGTSHETL